MYVHQYAEGELHQFIDGAVIRPNVHTHSPLTQTSFLLLLLLHTYIFISLYISTL